MKFKWLINTVVVQSNLTGLVCKEKINKSFNNYYILIYIINS